MADPNYICPRCNGEYLPIVSRLMTQVDVGSTKLDVEATSYYLGDMLCSNGGGAVAVPLPSDTVCMAWGKIQETIACPHLQAPLS